LELGKPFGSAVCMSRRVFHLYRVLLR